MSAEPPVLLVVAWTALVLTALAGFMMLAAYWLDVQDRPDLSRRERAAWSAAALLFPLAIPLYAFVGRPGWPVALRTASFVPTLALLLLLAFAFGLIR